MPSKLFESATDFFNALNDAATTESVNGKEVRVFRGSITSIFRSLGISQSYYSEIRQGLINGSCISILQQGTRSYESVIVLHQPPVEDEFVSDKSLDLTKPNSLAILSQQVNDLQHLIGGLSVPDALVTIEHSIKELDNRITKIEQQQKGR